MTNGPLQVAKAYIEASGNTDGDFRRHIYYARKLLERCDGDIVWAIEILRACRNWARDKRVEWSIRTCLKHFHELHPSAPEGQKVVEIDKGVESLHELMKKRYGGRTS